MKKIIVAGLLILFSNRLVIGNVGSLTATPGHNKVMLTWINDDGDIVTLVRNMWRYPGTISEGTLVYKGTNTTYTDRGLINTHIYYYTAFDSAGSFSCAFTTPQRDTSPPEPPGTITEGTPTDKDLTDTNSYTVYWNSANDQESEIIEYELQERENNGSWTLVVRVNALNYSFYNKTAGNLYSYRVCAKNEAELWGTWSTCSDGIRVVNKAVELPATQTIGYGEVKVDIPTNAFVGSVTFTISEISTPVDFASSTPKMKTTLSPCYELSAFGTQMQKIQPIASLTLIFSYTPCLLGTETEYRIYRLEENWWKVIGTPTIIPEENVMILEVGSLSTYVVGWPERILPTLTTFTAEPTTNREIIFKWGFPADLRVTEMLIIRQTGTYARTIDSGTQIFIGTRTQIGATYSETIENLGTISYYSAFASDGGANYSLPLFAQAIATDTTPPGWVGSFSVKGEFKKIVLNWTNPQDTDFEGIEIIRHLYHFPQNPKDGTLIYKGKETVTTDEWVVKGQTYYYTAFSFDGISYSLATTSTQGSATLIEDNSPPSTIGTITEGNEITEPDRDVSETGNYWIIWTSATDPESDIVSYELQERKNSEDWKKVSDNITSTYYFMIGREPGSKYDYRVRAKNGANMRGSWSITSDGIRVVNSYFYLPGTISFTSGPEKIEVDVPNDAFEGTTTFTITNSSNLPVTNFAQATPKIKKLIAGAWQLLAINQNNEEQIPTTPITIFIRYPDAGLSPNEEERIKIYRLNEGRNCWEILPASQIVSLEDKMIKATITTLSTFIVALPSYPTDTLGEIKVYPNPFKPTKGHDKITFEGLENNVTIRIYKITGELVYEKEHLSTDGYDYWYVTNNQGEPLASGVYIYIIEGSGGKAVGKIAIIR